MQKQSMFLGHQSELLLSTTLYYGYQIKLIIRIIIGFHLAYLYKIDITKTPVWIFSKHFYIWERSSNLENCFEIMVIFIVNNQILKHYLSSMLRMPLLSVSVFSILCLYPLIMLKLWCLFRVLFSVLFSWRW